MKQIGIFITLPFVLALPPIVGWYLGTKLDDKFNSKPLFMYLCIVLGFVAGFREAYRIIKRFGNEI
jgi:ATP synthase protein I